MNVLFRSIAGSKLFGLDNDDSDTDYTTVYLPTLKELLLGTHIDTIDLGTGAKFIKNKNTDTDMLCYSLPFFIRKAATGKQQFIDAIHSTCPTVTSPLWNDLVANRHRLYSKNMLHSVEFIDRQIYSYGHMHEVNIALENVLRCVNQYAMLNRTRGKKVLDIANILPVDRNCYWVQPHEGGYRPIDVSEVTDRYTFYRVNGKLLETSLMIDDFSALVDKQLKDNLKLTDRKELTPKAWKEIMHAMRTGYQVLHIVRNGGFTYPLPETEFLRSVRSGVLDFSRDVQPVAEELVANIRKEILESDLPDNVDTEFWENWLYKAYGNQYNLPYDQGVI